MAVVAVAALPVVLTEAVPVSFEASSDVTGIVMLPEPSKAVAVPVAAPDRAIVLAVASLVAVAALPVHEPEEPEQFPVTFPLSAPLNVVAVTTFSVVMVTSLMESVPEADSIILDV